MPESIDTILLGSSGWDWGAFWVELVAGLITFGLGAFVAFLLIGHELRLNRKHDFEQFQELSRQVLDDFEHIQKTLTSWRSQIADSRPVSPIDPRPLTWEIGDALVKFAFAQKGLQLAAQLAVNWYRQALNAARAYNEALEAGEVSDEVAGTASYLVLGASSQTESAISLIEKRARLGPSTALWRRTLTALKSTLVSAIGIIAAALRFIWAAVQSALTKVVAAAIWIRALVRSRFRKG